MSQTVRRIWHRCPFSPTICNEWSYVVEPQENQIITVIEHSKISFSEKVDDEGYYIVYSWGDGPDLLEELDFRGH